MTRWWVVIGVRHEGMAGLPLSVMQFPDALAYAENMWFCTQTAWPLEALL